MNIVSFRQSMPSPQTQRSHRPIHSSPFPSSETDTVSFCGRVRRATIEPVSGESLDMVGAFFAAIAENADDSIPRLVFADWLDEHNCGNSASLLRFHDALQSELPEVGIPFEDRIKALEEPAKTEWRRLLEGPLKKFKGKINGFYEGLPIVSVPAKNFLKHQAVFQQLHCPALRVRLDGTYLEHILAQPSMADLLHLNLGRTFTDRVSRVQPVGYSGATVLAASPALAGLRSLDLTDNNLNNAALEALVSSKTLTQLRALALASNDIGTAGVRILAASQSLGQLQKLDLGDNEIYTNSVEILAASTTLTQLRELDLGNNRVTNEGVQALASSPAMGQLRSLDLNNCMLGTAAAQHLAGSPHLAKLRVLRLEQNTLGTEGARALAASTNLPQLRVLGARFCHIQEPGLEALADSTTLPHLRSLDIGVSHPLFNKPRIKALAKKKGWNLIL